MSEFRKEDIKIAIIGGGAITESFFLPALDKIPGMIENVILADIDDQRLKYLSSQFGIKRTTEKYRDVIDEVDAAIIATPNHLHFPIGMDFLRKGKHILCEKPLAETKVEAQKLIDQAHQSGVLLAVNNTRRLFPSYKKVKELVSGGTIGSIKSVKYFEGGEFTWPTNSGFYFRSKDTPRGVLMDRGAHVIDLICWWLGGKPELISSKNDSFGGPEAVAHICIQKNGTEGQIKLSWLNKLENKYVIEGDRGAISGSIYDRNEFNVIDNGEIQKIMLDSKVKSFYGFGDALIQNFINAIYQEEDLLIPGEDVIDSIEFLEDAYRNSERFDLPWYESLEEN